MAIGFSSAYTITYISPLNGSIYINQTPVYNATIDIPYIFVGMSFNGVDGYGDLDSIGITQYKQGLNNWSVVFYGDSDDYYGDLIYFYYYSDNNNWFNNIKTWIINSINNLFFKKGENLNIETKNITNVSYIKLNEVVGACDLTINHSICSNATGTYIVG